MKHSRSGFTLVEIVIVITVIVILTAILFPIVSSAREKSREANCQSNLKQIYGAYRLCGFVRVRPTNIKIWAFLICGRSPDMAPSTPI